MQEAFSKAHTLSCPSYVMRCRHENNLEYEVLMVRMIHVLLFHPRYHNKKFQDKESNKAGITCNYNTLLRNIPAYHALCWTMTARQRLEFSQSYPVFARVV
jgi:hypothetical protein